VSFHMAYHNGAVFLISGSHNISPLNFVHTVTMNRLADVRQHNVSRKRGRTQRVYKKATTVETHGQGFWEDSSLMTLIIHVSSHCNTRGLRIALGTQYF